MKPLDRELAAARAELTGSAQVLVCWRHRAAGTIRAGSVTVQWPGAYEPTTVTTAQLVALRKMELGGTVVSWPWHYAPLRDTPQPAQLDPRIEAAARLLA